MVLDIPKPGASFTEGITLLGLLFDRIQVSRTQDRDIVTFIQRYENLKVRFWQWGEATRLDKLHIDAVVDINIRPEMYDVVRGSMVAIRLLFRTCQKIATRHSAELFEMSDVESDDGEALEQTNTPNFWAGFVNKLGHSLHRSWLGWRWTVTDRRQFDDLLIQLIMLIGDLEKWQPELVVMGSAVAVA